MTERVGIVVEATDKATAVLMGIGKAGKGSMDAIRIASEKTGNALKAVGIASTLMNQTLELGKKGFEMFRASVLDTVATAFEFRDAMDPAVKQVKQFGIELRIVRARVGDVMIPMLQGLHDALGPVIDEFTNWINTNRVLIGTKLVGWLETVGNVLITSVAKGILMVSKAWTGWLEIWQIVKGVTEKYFEIVLKGAEKALDHVGWLASAFSDDLAKNILTARDAVKDLGSEFATSSDESFKKVAELSAQQGEFEKSLASVEAAAQKVWGEAAVAMIERLKQSVACLTTTEEQRALALKKHMEMVQGYSDSLTIAFGRQSAAYARAANDSEAYAKKLEADQAATAQAIAGVATTITSAWGAAALAMADGSKSAGQAAMDASLASAETMLNAAAVVAAGEAIKAHSGIPIVGVAIGTAVAGTVFALIKSKLSQLPRAERGLRVKGGIPGVDSVPVMMQQDEVALDKNQTRLIDRLVASLERGAGTGGGQTMILNYTDASAIPAHSADTKRKLREVSSGLTRMKRRRM